MSDDPDLDAAIEDIQAKSNQVQAALARIRGTGTAGNGTVTAIVDSSAHLRDLKLTREALRWGDRLASIILQATAAAEKDAATQVQAAIRPLTRDQRVAAGIRSMRETLGQSNTEADARTMMTEEEIQAADDAYFERMNQRGWSV
ncbi:YbaB/EbfC family nucleoid-associated protein [Nocardia sp. NPDC057440]|uniref:YbaB/EbfC family nucleoid-associated protein n=1 Tax=Nocardia sp. NPDC057440 TaxID=3346134 RepID=UPI003672D8D3